MLHAVYLICFLAGATLMVCQFLLGLLGIGDHGGADGHDFHDAGGHDVHGDTGHDTHGGPHHGGKDSAASWFVGVLTFRSLAAALTFFGLFGLAVSPYLDWPRDLAVATAAGVGTLYVVAYMMRSLHRLKAEGTARIERSVGKNGTVYLAIPGHKAGSGKVTLNLQNRTVEYQAVTPHADLPTGAKVVVVGVVGPDTVEVMPATDSGRLTHV
jgi:membrane protein implicated in regulation of membrane protease activity